MNKNCYICNKQDGGVENATTLFDTKAPKSGLKVSEILCNMSGSAVSEESKISTTLCATCYKNLLEYDFLLNWVQEMKASMCSKIAKSNILRSISKDIKKEEPKDEEEKKPLKKLVLPASKLQVLPPNYVLKPNALVPKLSKPLVTVPSNLKPILMLKKEEQKNITFKKKVLPKDRTTISMPMLEISSDSIVCVGRNPLGEDGSNEVLVLENDERPMEIDDDCPLSEFVKPSQRNPMNKENDKSTDGMNYYNIVISGTETHTSDKIIFSKVDDLNIKDGEDDGENSNDESQIELLELSGDEETANAIIAAAQVQGGAFIKVESGEMFRVESVESKIQNSDTDNDATEMIAPAGDKLKCLICDRSNKEFISAGVSMGKHLQSVHGSSVHVCECGRVFSEHGAYTKHRETHTKSSSDKGKQHKCDVCEKNFSSRSLLEEHTNKHTGKRPYTCDVCHKTFTSKYTHQAHMKIHMDRPRPFRCAECGKSFFTEHNLLYHHKTHLGVKDFICKECGKAFSTQHNLEVHGVVHSGMRPFVCDVCEKAFARRAELRDHMRVHTGERPFECETCGACFSQRSNLYSHRRATHLNDRRYHCTSCNKKFKRRRLLDYHVMACHTGERPLKCDLCQATFVYPEHHKKHMRIHSEDKPFQCEVCGKGFNSRDNRNIHRFVHSDRKPYECVLCGAGYMRKHQLYQHMNTANHIAESIVVNQPRVKKMNDNRSIVSVESVIVNKETHEKLAIEEVDEANFNSGRRVVEVKAGSESPPKFYISTSDKKLVFQDGKTLDISQEEDEEPTLVTIHNIDGGTVTEDGVIENFTAEQLQNAQIIGEGNEAVRLIQIELPNGNSGWVAVSQ